MKHLIYSSLLLSASVFVDAAEVQTESTDTTSAKVAPIEGLNLSEESLRIFYEKPEEERETLVAFLKELIPSMPNDPSPDEQDRVFRYGNCVHRNNASELLISVLKNKKNAWANPNHFFEILMAFWLTMRFEWEEINTPSKKEGMLNILTTAVDASNTEKISDSIETILGIIKSEREETIPALVDGINAILQNVKSYTSQEVSKLLAALHLWTSPHIRKALVKFYVNRLSQPNTTWALSDIFKGWFHKDIDAQKVDNAANNLIKLSDELKFKKIAPFVQKTAEMSEAEVQELIDYVKSFEDFTLSEEVLGALHKTPTTEREEAKAFILEVKSLIPDLSEENHDKLVFASSIIMRNTNARIVLIDFLRKMKASEWATEDHFINTLGAFAGFVDSRIPSWDGVNTPEEKTRVVDNLVAYIDAFPILETGDIILTAFFQSDSKVAQTINTAKSILQAVESYTREELAELITAVKTWKPNVSKALAKFYTDRLTLKEKIWKLEDISTSYSDEDIAPEKVNNAARNLIKLSSKLKFKKIAPFIEKAAEMSEEETQELIDYVLGFACLKRLNLPYDSVIGTFFNLQSTEERGQFRTIINTLLPFVPNEHRGRVHARWREDTEHEKLIAWVQKRGPGNIIRELDYLSGFWELELTSKRVSKLLKVPEGEREAFQTIINVLLPLVKNDSSSFISDEPPEHDKLIDWVIATGPNNIIRDLDYLRGFSRLKLDSTMLKLLLDIPIEGRETFKEIINTLLSFVPRDKYYKYVLVDSMSGISSSGWSEVLEKFRADQPTEGPSQENFDRIENIICSMDKK